FPVLVRHHVLPQICERVSEIVELCCDVRRNLVEEHLIRLTSSFSSIFDPMPFHLCEGPSIMGHYRRVDPAIHCGIAYLSWLILYPVLKESGHLVRRHYRRIAKHLERDIVGVQVLNVVE